MWTVDVWNHPHLTGILLTSTVNDGENDDVDGNFSEFEKCSEEFYGIF